MNAFVSWTLAPDLYMAAAQLAVAGLLTASLAVMLDGLLRRRSAPTRYAVLRASIVALLLAPPAVEVLRVAGFGVITLPIISKADVLPVAAAVALPVVVKDLDRASGPVRTNAPVASVDVSSVPAALPLAMETMESSPPIASETPIALREVTTPRVPTDRPTSETTAAVGVADENTPLPATLTAARDSTSAMERSPIVPSIPAVPTIASWLVVVWGLGIAWYGLVALRGGFAVRRLLRPLEPLATGAIASQVAAASRRMGLPSAPRSFGWRSARSRPLG